MSVRPPRSLAPKSHTTAFEEALDHEIRGEMAGTHGRLMRVLQKRLQALADHDAEHSAEATPDRDALVAAAGEALWHIVVQRELMGLRRTNAFLDEYAIPREVRLRMGMRPHPSSKSAGQEA